MVPDSAIEQVSQSSESGVLCRGESCLPFVKSAQLFSAMKCMQLEQSRSACIWRSPGPNQPFCFGPRSVGQEYRKRSSGGRCVSAPWGGSWAGGPTPRLTSSSVSLLSCSSRASPPSPCGTLLSRALGFLTARWSQGNGTSPSRGRWRPGRRKWRPPENQRLRLGSGQCHFCHILLLKAVLGPTQAGNTHPISC